MPLPRFDKLEPAKQRRLLDAALAEFGERGFQQASMNQVIKRAGISKGAMYYYFADKEDLFRTAIQDILGAAMRTIRQEARTPDGPAAFWEEVARMMAIGTAWFHAHPQALALVRSGMQANASGQLSGVLGDLSKNVIGAMQQVIALGQKLGAVREDLPDDYVQPLVLAVARTSHQWLVSHAHDSAGAEQRIALVVDTYRRVVGSERLRPD